MYVYVWTALLLYVALRDRYCINGLLLGLIATSSHAR